MMKAKRAMMKVEITMMKSQNYDDESQTNICSLSE